MYVTTYYSPPPPPPPPLFRGESSYVATCIQLFGHSFKSKLKIIFLPIKNNRKNNYNSILIFWYHDIKGYKGMLFFWYKGILLQLRWLIYNPHRRCSINRRTTYTMKMLNSFSHTFTLWTVHDWTDLHSPYFLPLLKVKVNREHKSFENFPRLYPGMWVDLHLFQ